MTEIYTDGWHPKKSAENDNRIADLLAEAAGLAKEREILKARLGIVRG